MFRSIAFVLIGLSIGWSGQATACSVVDSYRIPTNFELVQRADMIVLARVASGPADMDHGADEPGIVLETVRVLKGDPPREPLRLFGSVAWNGMPMVSLPTPLGPSHFSAGLGACIRMFYPQDGLLVAMFQNTPDGPRQIFDPWARAVEDVEAPDGVWVRAIEEYLAILAEAADGNVRNLVEARQAALMAQADDMVAQAIAIDLRRHLEVTAPGDASARSEPFWTSLDLPSGSGAFLRRSDTPDGRHLRGVGLRCEPGQQMMSIDLVGQPQLGELALVIGGHRYEATDETVATMQETAVLSGHIAFSAALAEVMRTSAAFAGAQLNGSASLSAPPGDVLQKFALRCAQLLSN